ncbi:MAG: T9SS type A sorting domain-containing protein, partial [Candidatus Celaenobacter polaris]|nr:T9SS type A sorting domain-containing protein [Candidatus Celaenobacter polaris]
VDPGQEPEVATTYLNQNFPNPVTSNTNISFNLKANSDVKISVYNIKGQLVETLVDNEMVEGPHTLTWNSKSLSNGIYFLRLETQETTITKKMLIIR